MLMLPSILAPALMSTPFPTLGWRSPHSLPVPPSVTDCMIETLLPTTAVSPIKNVGFVSVYNRLVVVYSRDLAYVLSLTCPESRVAENENDFEAMARGLVIKKSRRDLTF